MKNFYILGTMTLIALVSGCNKTEVEPVVLATPEPQIDTVSATSASIVWEAVENAASYAYSLNEGEELTTTEPKVTFEGLAAETEYNFKVKAVSGDSGLYADSEWATITFTTSEEIFVIHYSRCRRE